MKPLIALALMLAVTAQADTIIATADCTTSCRLVTDPIPKAVIGVDTCDVWKMGLKVASTKYYGGTVLPMGELPIQVGCLWNVTIPEGETWYLTADWVRPDWQYSENSNVLIITSIKGAVLLQPPQNLRVSSCDGLLDLLLRDSAPLSDRFYT
jgi:hypothetical protein